MGMLGEMFPGPKITDEGSEDGSGQRWRLGPIDLERGVVEVHRVPESQPPDPEAEPRQAPPA